MSLKIWNNKKIKIRTGILFETVSILIATVIIIISYTYYSNTKAIIEQSEIAMQTSAESLQRQIFQTLKNAETLVEIYAPILQNTSLDDSLLGISGFSRSLTDALNNNPSVTSLYFGTKSGYLYQISPLTRSEHELNASGVKMPEEPIIAIFKTVNHSESNEIPNNPEIIGNKNADEVNEIWTFVNEQFKTSTQVGQKTKFDPRKRDWYKNSIITEKTTWSDLYIFASLLKNEVGISVSKTMYKDSVPVGVFSADLTVTTFSEFLQHSKITPNSSSYIINEKDEILATSKKESTVVNNTNGLALVKVNEFNDEVIKAAYDNFKSNKGKDSILFFKHNGIDYIASFQDFPKIFTSNWKGVVISPMEDFVGKINESRNSVLIFSLFVVLIAMILSFRLAHRIAKPIVSLANEAKNIKDLKLNDTAKIDSNITEIQNLSDSIHSLKTSMKAFSYYIPRALVQKLLQQKSAIHIGGRSKEITMMFSDIEGFTSISEKISAENLVYHLSDYFEEMTKIIIDRDGTVDKFIGDAIMAFWGAPAPDKNHALNACQAALHCQKKLKQQNLVWKKGEKPIFPTRIGIHTGNAIVGNIGSSERMNYTAIGDNINFASRLEGLNKYYGTNILISETVNDKIKGKFLTRPLDKIAVKGKNTAIKVYELIGQLSGDDSLLPDESQEIFVDYFEKAYHLFLTRQFKEAYEAFQYIDEQVKVSDKSVHIYLERCKEYLKNPPPHEWDGSYKIDVKY